MFIDLFDSWLRHENCPELSGTVSVKTQARTNCARIYSLRLTLCTPYMPKGIQSPWVAEPSACVRSNPRQTGDLSFPIGRKLAGTAASNRETELSASCTASIPPRSSKAAAGIPRVTLPVNSKAPVRGSAHDSRLWGPTFVVV